MNKIIMDEALRLRLINLNPLVHTESEIYHDYNMLYKIFVNQFGIKKSAFISYLKSKKQKIEILSTMKNLPNAVLPQDMVFNENSLFSGFTMDYIPNTKTLYEYFKSVDYGEFLKMLTRISVSLKKMHRRGEGIVIGDLSFLNILIDLELLFYFIDFDNISLTSFGLTSERISPQMSEYFEYKGKMLKINKNFDRMSFLLSFFECIFEKPIYAVSLYEYDEKAEKLKVLSELREIVKDIQREDVVPEVPYFHEVMYTSLNDNLRMVKK